VAEVERIDQSWLAAHPLPPIAGGKDKEARGRVLIVGGSTSVPGALLLTADAALRVGAGKVQLGTVASATLPLGIAMPEAAVIALPEDEAGEIAETGPLTERIARCDTLVLGPAMSPRPHTAALVEGLLAELTGEATLLLDAAALTAIGGCVARLKRRPRPAVLTPHHGELATLLDIAKERIEREPERHARDAAERFGVVVALKSSETIVAAPGEASLRYRSEAPGLGTAGSGDVLAGVIGGLLARGAAPLVATAWGVWLHGEAGRAAGVAIGPLGYRASELAAFVPRLMSAVG
jgi:hydroxyethylthiazole kinase-like uncharacterized protein yjeF